MDTPTTPLEAPEEQLATFENMTGASPFNCKPLVIYKFNPISGGPFSSQSAVAPFIPYTFRGTPGTWSPQPPMLDLGRAAFIQVKTFTPDCPSPFQVSGVVPNQTNAVSAAKLFVTGCGFLPGAVVTLKKSGKPTRVPISVTQDCVGTVLVATFNLAGASSGPWTLQVKQGAVTNTTPLVIIGPCDKPDLRLQWLGQPQIPLNASPQTYVLAYDNIGCTSKANITVTDPFSINVIFTPSLPACVNQSPLPAYAAKVPVNAGDFPKYVMFTLTPNNCTPPFSRDMTASSPYGAPRTLTVGVGQFPLAPVGKSPGLPAATSASAYKSYRWAVRSGALRDCMYTMNRYGMNRSGGSVYR